MYGKFNLATAILTLALFSYAQQQGWSLFDDVANSPGRTSGSSRGYHK